MKRKIFSVLFSMILGLLVLIGCVSNGTPPKSTNFQATKASSSQSSRPKEKDFSLKEKEAFVTQFLTAYTTYSSVNAQKAALKPFLTDEMKNQLAVNTTVSPDLNQVTSVGEGLSVWHNTDENQWLGLVRIEINSQTRSTEVFLIGLETEKTQFLVNQLSCPTQE